MNDYGFPYKTNGVLFLTESTFMSFLELVHIIFAFEVNVELKPTDKQAVTCFSHFPVTGRENQ